MTTATKLCPCVNCRRVRRSAKVASELASAAARERYGITALTAAQRRDLERVRDDVYLEASRRARAILLLADGAGPTKVARQLRVSRMAVWDWTQAWRAGGAAALEVIHVGRPRGPAKKIA